MMAIPRPVVVFRPALWLLGALLVGAASWLPPAEDFAVRVERTP